MVAAGHHNLAELPVVLHHTVEGQQHIPKRVQYRNRMVAENNLIAQEQAVNNLLGLLVTVGAAHKLVDQMQVFELEVLHNWTHTLQTVEFHTQLENLEGPHSLVVLGVDN